MPPVDRASGLRHPHVFARLVNTPLLTTPANAYGWVTVLAERSGFSVAELRGQQVAPARHRVQGGAPSLRASVGGAYRPYPIADGGIAVIEIDGSLANKWGARFCGTVGYDWITAAVQAAAADPEVRGILLDINSPGGEVAGCFDCADTLRAAGQVKPLWACLSEIALSGGYALASQAARILVPRTGWVGSIGVVTMHVDLSRQVEAAGVTLTLIHAGAHKVDANPYEPLPDGVRAELQATCERSRRLFAATVARGRGLDVAAVLATEARCFEGADGVKAGLADDVMSPAAALEAFRDYLAGRDDDSPAAVTASKRSRTMAGKQGRSRPSIGSKRGTGRMAGTRKARRANDDRPEDDVEDEDLPEDAEDDLPDEEAEDEDLPEDVEDDLPEEDAEDEDLPEDVEDDLPEEDVEDEEPKDPQQARGYRKGRRAEARRWTSVMKSAVAKGRTRQAVSLLGNRKLSVREIKGLLAGMPKARRKGGGLSAAMAGVPNVRVSGGNGASRAPADKAKTIVADYRMATGRSPRRG